MLPLRNPIQRYDWGSPDRLAEFLGEPPDGQPQAELWIGAHPAAPSLARLHPGGEDGWLPLDQLIADDPQRWVGVEVLERFGPTLPFLFKVLAAAQPLSLQLHPDLAAARAGFASDEAAGIALTDPARRYRDPNHKPELLVALDGFEVLSGFRPPSEIARVFRAFGLPTAWVRTAGQVEPGELCARLWQLDPAEVAALVDAVLRAAGPAAAAGVGDGLSPRPAGAKAATTAPAEPAAAFAAEADFVRRAAAVHPGDIGVVVGLCLNRASLVPGQGAFAEPGVLHSYLGGFGLEIMANSDNVLRGGLTTKAVDIAELRRHLVGHSTTPRRLEAQPHPLPGGVEARFAVLVEEFALSSLHPDPDPDPGSRAGGSMVVRGAGPEILLCVSGTVTVQPGSGTAVPGPAGAEGAMVLSRGHSVFVPAGPGSYRVSGAGVLYRAQVGTHARRLWAH